MSLIALTLEVLFFLVIASFAAYVLLELRMVLISRKTEARKRSDNAPSPSPAPDFFPSVCVFLPICNEFSVIEGLIEAVCQLRYPKGHWEILVLDDSTDGATSELALSLVTAYADKGLPIRCLRRPSREGSKAENLRFGVSQTNAEFFAVFDADFLPPEDFLLKTLPCFLDKRLGYLQTGIDYVNRDASFLTKFQAVMMRHQQYVTAELKSEGKMASLSGSSCVWRRTCLEAIGGWNASTVTEDVDAGYRAQFSDWRYAYLKDVVSFSRLPETVGAFRVQRERWGRGLVHNAFKHGHRAFTGKMRMMRRVYAISMIFSSLLLAAMYGVFLLSMPLTALSSLEGGRVIIISLLFFALAAVWGAGNLINSRMWDSLADNGGPGKKFLALYAYLAMILPMSLYYFIGGLRSFSTSSGEFIVTPKGANDCVKKKSAVYTLLPAGELFSFAYSLVTVGISLYVGNYVFLPLTITACVGFGMVIFWGLQENGILCRGGQPE